MRAVLFLFVFAFANVALAQLGSISVSFQDEDPATGNNVDATISLGDSLEATLTLSPPPALPIRFDVVSTIPDIVKVSHATITFNRGQSSGTVTLESPPDGKIGVATIIVTPEKPGFYTPITFDILVQGTMIIGFVDPDVCVGVSVPEIVQITVVPPSPESIDLNVSAVGGTLNSDVAVIPLGQTSTTIEYTGSEIGPSSISVTTDLYTSVVLSFDTLGTIITNGAAELIENAPSDISVSVIPFNRNDLPNIFAVGGNAIVTPATFTLSDTGISTVEVIPLFAGVATVTYSANDYCPRTDVFPVNPEPICAEGFIPNILGDSCVMCPGNDVNDPSIHCNDEGTCSFSKCVDSSAVCFCFFPFIGYACQIDSTSDEHFDQALLNEKQFKLVIDDLENTSGPTKFLAPGNLITDDLQTGRAIVEGYFPDEPFFGAVDPTLNPPANSVFSGIGWNWENTCSENTLITEPFQTAPVSVQINVFPEAFSNLEILQVGLYVYDTDSQSWLNSADVCEDVGFDRSILTAQLYDLTLVTDFCKPGQYALFIVPNSAPVPNTGNTNPPFPTLDQQSGTSAGTGRGGFQPAAPLPLPVEEDLSAYNPSLNVGSSSDASMLSVSIALVFAVLLMI